ncbi:MAG: PAS domain-containing sensor histidine kinase [Devosia sp.]|nr:PAS domain-containing sensor histidine kinase [Devosia sp.]
MDAQWIKSPTGRRVIAHWADPRPSWLWLADGQTLLWHNITARAFHGKTKSRTAGEVLPIRGQVSRLIRLGALNRPSLARMQFVVGDRPISATCACTPLLLGDGQQALLVVNVDPIPLDELEFPLAADQTLEALFPPGAEYLLVDDDTQFASGSRQALERYAPVIESEGMPLLSAEGHGVLEIGGAAIGFTRFKASPQDASLLLFDSPGEQGRAAQEPPASEVEPVEPLLPIGLLPAEGPQPQPPVATAEEHWIEPLGDPSHVAGGLSSLFDRLLDDSALFEPLRPDEDFVVGALRGPAPAHTETPESPALPESPPAELPATPVELQPAAGGEGAETAIPEALALTGDAPALETAAEAPAPVVTAFAAAAEAEVTVAAAAEAPADEPPAPRAEEIAEAPPAIPAAAETPGVTPAGTLYRIVGRSFTPIVSTLAVAEAPPAATDLAAEAVSTPVESQSPTGDAAADAVPTHANLDDLLAALTPAVAEAVETAEQSAAAALAQSAEPEAGAESAAASPPSETEATAGADSGPGPSADAVERVSRYNFDELSRILTDRVGSGERAASDGADRRAVAARPALPAVPSATPEGALVTLGGETLVLNRLPLGILVFRDQQVLFANRAITEMTGYDSVEGLRTAGLSAIFPAAGDETQQAGPVNHLVQRSGMLVPVTARLQSVSWQGKPALMLSASATEVRTGHEAAVRAFAELVATNRADGFLETGRSGIVSHASAEARLALGLSEEQLIGRPISQLAAPDELAALKAFLDRPARFAETARPAITFRGTEPGIEILLFAQGQAGIVSGYFGFVRRREAALMPSLAAPLTEADPLLLERVSRGVRRPLNTVIGFADLIGSAAFGPIANERYLEYARDIKTAGLEIATLVDELDDFARLRDGRYAARASDIDLVALLETSIIRVRGQANAARVLVRSAISERLPRIRADRASLAQAVLNLLASAIDQTPQGSSVVLSAQVDDAGGITIHVRDSAHHAVDVGERFTVFRDGTGRDGEVLAPVRSSVGLALTRALLAVNAATLNIEPTFGAGRLFSLVIPPENVVIAAQVPVEKP